MNDAISPASSPEFRLGEGRISGLIGLVCGMLATGGVFCLLFPGLLTAPEAKDFYAHNLGIFRGLIELFIVGAFFLGLLSVRLSRSKKLGLAGLLFSVLATLMGGAQAKIGADSPRPIHFGLDYFLLELLVLCLIFIPLERMFARVESQKILRDGWGLDMQHFFLSHVGVQVISFLIAWPAKVAFSWALSPAFQAKVAAQPFLLQIAEILLIVDFISYWIHVAFHKVSWLWKFHAVHHSPEHMDWLAGSRSHFVDTIVNRSLAYIPVFLMGFAMGPFLTYLTFVSFHAVFIHANVRWQFPVLRWILATPEFHHWHHAKDEEGIDKNFAVFLPVYDWLFRTAHMPGTWPKELGVAGEPLPQTFVGQFIYPFKTGK